MENLLPEIAERKSPVIFDARKIETQKLDAVLEAARWAPSSFNHQPWRYLVIDEPTALKKVHKGLSRGNFWAHHAPVLLIVLSRPDLDDIVDGKTYYLYDTGLSVMSLVIEAVHQGLATHQMIGFDEAVIKKEFGIPDPWRVITVVAMGYAGDLHSQKTSLIKKIGMQLFEKLRARLLSPRMRKKREEIVAFNTFHFLS